MGALFNRGSFLNMGYEINMDFYKDWIDHLRKGLKQAGYTPAEDQEEVSI